MPRDIEKRRQQNREAAERSRRRKGAPVRTCLSLEEERLRGIRYSTNYRNQNRDRVNAWRRKHSANLRKDPTHRMMLVLRSRVSQAMGRGVNKPMSTAEGLGCTYAELRTYLEKQFDSKMSWKNYGRKGWHIDHIKPLASFNLLDPKQFAKACHFTNLQPLWWRDNLIKGARLQVVRGS